MENTIYIGLSKQMVLQNSMNTIANNIANMNTSGFRAQHPVFEEFISDPQYNDDPLSFVYDYGQYQNTAPGSIEQTGNQLNIALSGPGFISIEMPDGKTAYTRDGNFQKTADGTLVNSSSFPVIGDGGPISIPPTATEVTIDERGVVSDQNGPIGQIKIVEFENVQDLEPKGNNLYVTDAPEQEAQNTIVKQGFLEGSNVNPVLEVTDMIKVLRSFQGVQKMLESEHERLISAIQKLSARIG